MPIKVAANIPKNTTKPTDTQLAAPAPKEITNGETPKIKNREAIITARKRIRAASIAAASVLNPYSRRTFANSTIRIALFANSRLSITMPIIHQHSNWTT